MGTGTNGIIYEMFGRPATTLVVAACSGIWLWGRTCGLDYDHAGLNYERILQGHWWRMVSSAMTHISFLHLVFNMSSIWSLGFVEQYYGFYAYLVFSLALLFGSSLVTLLVYHVLVVTFGQTRYLRVFAVGYSAVVFGWMTVAAVLNPTGSLSFFGYLNLPVSFAPFSSLIFTSIIVPQASFIGHLAGILVGFLVGWGAFDWLLPYYWSLNCALWAGIVCLGSLKVTANPPWLSGIELLSGGAPSARPAAIIEGGVLIRNPQAGPEPPSSTIV
eukprot:tig00000241_g20930.t1